MNEVTVKTTDLLSKLKENRDKHAQLYRDAVDGYKTVATGKLNKALSNVERGQLVTSVKLDVPRDHTENYDEVIAMLEMSTDEEIVIPKYEFNNYVLDKWVSIEEKSIMRTFALSSANSALYK